MGNDSWVSPMGQPFRFAGVYARVTIPHLAEVLFKNTIWADNPDYSVFLDIDATRFEELAMKIRQYKSENGDSYDDKSVEN